MGKAVTVTVAVFGVGAFAMRLLAGWVGVFAEPLSMGIIGAGLYAGSQMLGAKWTAVQPDGEPVKTP